MHVRSVVTGCRDWLASRAHFRHDLSGERRMALVDSRVQNGDLDPGTRSLERIPNIGPGLDHLHSLVETGHVVFLHQAHQINIIEKLSFLVEFL